MNKTLLDWSTLLSSDRWRWWSYKRISRFSRKEKVIKWAFLFFSMSMWVKTNYCYIRQVYGNDFDRYICVCVSLSVIISIDKSEEKEIDAMSTHGVRESFCLDIFINHDEDENTFTIRAIKWSFLPLNNSLFFFFLWRERERESLHRLWLKNDRCNKFCSNLHEKWSTEVSCREEPREKELLFFSVVSDLSLLSSSSSICL